MERYAVFFRDHRITVLIFALMVSAAAAIGLGRLRFDDVPRGIFAHGDEDYVLLQELYEQFGSDDNDAILVCESDDWFLPRRVALLREAGERLRSLPGIESVFGLVDVPVIEGAFPRPLFPADGASPEAFAEASRRAAEHPLIPGLILSRDRGTTITVVRLAGEALSVAEMQPTVDSLRALARDLSGEGVRMRVTGVPPIRVDIYETIRREQIVFLLSGALLCSILALILFRSPGAVLASTTGPLLGTFWAFGLIGLFGGRVDLLSSSLPLICIVIGFTDAVHLVVHARDRRAAGDDRMSAATSSIEKLGSPCLLTSLTTAIGFASLTVGNVPSVQRFGLLAAIAVLCTFVAVLTTMPLLTSWLPRIGAKRSSPGFDRWRERFGGLIDGVTARAAGLSAAAVVLTIGLFWVASRLVPENRLMEATVPESEAHQALEHCERVFGGVLPAYVLMEWSEPLDFDSPRLVRVLGELEELLRGVQGVRAPVSALTLLRMLPGEARTLAPLSLFPTDLVLRFARRDLSRSVVTLGVPDGGTTVMKAIYDEIETGLRELEARHPAVSLRLTGTDVVARRSINAMIVGLAKSLFFAAFLIVLVIALEFRSASLGLISLIPNLFPLTVVATILVALDQPLQMSSAVVFSVLLGLAVDDTIHFLARYRRELHDIGHRDLPSVRAAIRRGFVGVGKAVSITTAVLFLGFAVGLTSEIPPNRLVAGLLCVGILAALVGDLLFLPALLAWRARGRASS